MSVSMFIEMQLVQELNYIHALLVMEKMEEVKEQLQTLRYPTVRPLPTIQEGLVEIKDSFEAKEYEVCSSNIMELVDKLNHNIFNFKSTKS